MEKPINRVLAVFDLDGTLISIDSMITFLFVEAGRFRVVSYFVLILPILILMVLRIVNVRYVKEMLLKHFFGNMSEEQLRNRGLEFSNTVLPQHLFPEVYAVLQLHRANGNTIMLLTAACDIWAEPWCTRENIIFAGTRLEFRNGKFTGKIDGANCYGMAKQQALQSFLKNNAFTEIVAYGNESADRFYMNMANKSYMIRKGKLCPYNEIS